MLCLSATGDAEMVDAAQPNPDFIVSSVGLNERLGRNRFTVPIFAIEAASDSAGSERA